MYLRLRARHCSCQPGPFPNARRAEANHRLRQLSLRTHFGEGTCLSRHCEHCRNQPDRLLAGQYLLIENMFVRIPAQISVLFVVISAFRATTCIFGLQQDWEEGPSASNRTAPNAPAPADRVDINRASIDELARLPGMTRSWAGRVVRFRPYRTKVDLIDRGILPVEVYLRFKDAIIAHHVPGN